MNYRQVVVVLLSGAVCGCGVSKARGEVGRPPQGKTLSGTSPVTPAKAGSPGGVDANAVAALRGNLLATHATIDGAPITDLRATARCTAVIVTAQSSIAVRWSQIGNLSPRLLAGRLTFNIPAGGRLHVVSAPAGDVGDRVDMGLGLLDADCGGG